MRWWVANWWWLPIVVANVWWSWWLPTTPKEEIVVSSGVCVVVGGTNVVAVLWVGTNQWSVQNQLILWNADVWNVDLLKGWIVICWKAELCLKSLISCWIGIDFWKAEWCWYDAWRIIGECFRRCCKFEFNSEWNEGYDKGWLKNSYLSDLTSVPDDLKFIGKFFKRSTTSMLMTSSNSEVLEVELRFEVETFVLKFFWYCSGLLCRKYQEVGKWFADFSAIANFRGNSTLG